MYSAELISLYIINKYNKSNKHIDVRLLSILLYYLQAEFLVRKDKPLFPDSIEAWDIGVIVPNIYKKYRRYITLNILDCNIDDIWQISNEDKEIIDGVLNQCLKFPYVYLKDVVHNQTPWSMSFSPSKAKTIPLSVIKQFFTDKPTITDDFYFEIDKFIFQFRAVVDCNTYNKCADCPAYGTVCKDTNVQFEYVYNKLLEMREHMLDK